jgi:hypothetical protein
MLRMIGNVDNWDLFMCPECLSYNNKLRGCVGEAATWWYGAKLQSGTATAAKHILTPLLLSYDITCPLVIPPAWLPLMPTEFHNHK